MCLWVSGSHACPPLHNTFTHYQVKTNDAVDWGEIDNTSTRTDLEQHLCLAGPVN